MTTRRSDALGTSQEVRASTSVGLLLGAGITPDEARVLTLDQIIVLGAKAQGVPCKLALPVRGVRDACQALPVNRAGTQLAYWMSVRARQGKPGE